MTPAANTTTEPLTSGMLLQFEEGQVVPTDPAQWLHSVTKREPSREDFLIDSTVPWVFVKAWMHFALANPRGDYAPEAGPTVMKTRNEENGRRIYITMKMVSEFGATLGCKGCLVV